MHWEDMKPAFLTILPGWALQLAAVFLLPA